jgi:prolyl 4-hydroxylase
MVRWCRCHLLLLLLRWTPRTTAALEYGVDISFPIHRENVSQNYDYLPHNALPSLYETPPEYQSMPIQPLGDRQSVYNEYMKGCVEHYGQKAGWKCWEFEQDRIQMSLRQPQSMINYTETVRTKD